MTKIRIHAGAGTFVVLIVVLLSSGNAALAGLPSDVQGTIETTYWLPQPDGSIQYFTGPKNDPTFYLQRWDGAAVGNPEVGFGEEDGTYQFDFEIQEPQYRIEFPMGNRYCDIYLYNSSSEQWFAPKDYSNVYDVIPSHTEVIDYDFANSGFLTQDDRYELGLHVAHHIWQMGVWFEELVGFDMPGHDVVREVRVDDPSLGFAGMCEAGHVIRLAPRTDELDRLQVIYHEMTHSVFHYVAQDGGFAMPLGWTEAAARYYPAAFSPAWEAWSCNSTQDLWHKGAVHDIDEYDVCCTLAKIWWDIREEIGSEVNVDFMIYNSAQHDITTLGRTMRALLIADDDDGVLSNGTPHLTEIKSAFEEYGIGLHVPKLWMLDGQVLGPNIAFQVAPAESHSFDVYDTYPFAGLEWDWGDGSDPELVPNSTSPSHTYATPGEYTITCKTYGSWHSLPEQLNVSTTTVPVIVGYEGALSIGDVWGCENGDFEVSVNLENEQATDFISLPLQYDGDVELSLTSVSTTGTRADGYTVTQVAGTDCVYVTVERPVGLPEIAAGDGPILTLGFSVENLVEHGDVTELRLDPYDSYELQVMHQGYPGLVSCSYGTVTGYEPGNANGDDDVNVGDAVYLIDYAFKDGPAPMPLEIGDANGDCSVNVGDAVYITAYAFRGGPPPVCYCTNPPSKVLPIAAHYSVGDDGVLTVATKTELASVTVNLAGGDSAPTSLTSGLDVFVSEDGSQAVVFDVDGAGVIAEGTARVLRLAQGSDVISVTGYTVDGREVALSLGAGELPMSFRLYDAYPNPFNPTTTIQYDMPEAGHARLTVYNTLGQQVRTLVDEFVAAGHQTIVWDGKTDAGQTASSGVYFYRLETENNIDSKKMILMK